MSLGLVSASWVSFYVSYLFMSLATLSRSLVFEREEAEDDREFLLKMADLSMLK